jgi:selenocysteine lyase/cysteine desulfurase
MEALEARNLFPLVDRYIFMNHAGVSPFSERVRAAVAHTVEELTEKPYPDGWSQDEADRVRDLVGRLIKAPASTISFTRGTAHGISLLAQGLDWKPGDNVVGALGEYPANVYPWMALAEQGIEFRQASNAGGKVLPESVLDLVDGRTRVVALSHVEFWNGYRVDIETIGAECRRRGVILAVDGIQSVGALHVDVSSLPVDYLAAGAYKWMMGANGFGFIYCRPELQERVRPVLVGPGSVKRNKEYFDYDLDYADGCRRFEESSLSILSLAAMGAAVELLLEVGSEAIERRVLGLSEMLGCGLNERGFEVIEPWPRLPAESSGILSARKPGSPIQATMRDLSAARVVVRIHSDFVRFSPHFYNTEDEVERVLEVLAPGSD